MSSADIDDAVADATGTDGAAAIDHIEARAAEIRSEQVTRAIQQLSANGDLTDAQRHAVERLAEQLTKRLLASPRTSLQAADQRTDDTAATAITLFSRGSGR